MDVFKAIQERHSIRRYLPDPILPSKLTRILEAARLAPSAANMQPLNFIVVSDRQKRDALSKSGMFASGEKEVIETHESRRYHQDNRGGI